ncbi:oxidoreductase [Vallitalea okinawensis]|uniref:oxidoreductase n=1 Tax=Vallitalea okinawensis TaxID=2078660 RepID=UPI001A9A51EC|nr:oxidoreductase [Vallitalea okinawensis]
MEKLWRFTDILSLKGKTILVTGGNSGLGYESVKMLASKHATVILASRSLERGVKAKANILNDIPNASIEVMRLDLGSLQSIKQFAEAFKLKYKQLNILLNNAGIMNAPYGKTSDGFEQQIGINHLGHYALTGHLFEVLKQTPQSRIVNISSLMHKKGIIDFDSFLYENGKSYNPQEAYAQSKLANLLFTYSLKKKVKEAQLNIKVLAAHPGGAKTSLGRYSKDTTSRKLIKKIIYPLLMQSATDGAMPGLRAALDSDAKSGMYLGPSGLFESSGQPYISKAAQSAYDDETAEKLWTISEELTGITYIFE